MTLESGPLVTLCVSLSASLSSLLVVVGAASRTCCLGERFPFHHGENRKPYQICGGVIVAAQPLLYDVHTNKPPPNVVELAA